MANNLSIPFFFSTSSFIFFFLPHLVSPRNDTCSISSCKIGEPEIRFPFRLEQFQPDERCVYPGFDLSCDGQNRTTLSIPPSGDFNVMHIDYALRAIWLRDPDNCLPKRLHDFNLSGSIWSAQRYTGCTFVKCPPESRASDSFPRVPCLDGQNQKYYVVAVETDLLKPLGRLLEKYYQCSYGWNISIPTTSDGSLPDTSFMVLTWDEPSNCPRCESKGDLCGFKGKKGLETRCIIPPPYPDMDTLHPPPYPPPYPRMPESSKRGTPYQLIIPGISVPCFVFIMYLIDRKLRARRLAQQDQINLSPPPSRAQDLVLIPGLDTPTIKSYPTTCVGHAEGSMPRDDSCSICLSEYKSNEVLRTLPECKHSFHAHCIDPWLKRNASCPVCRNHQGSAKSTVSTQQEDFQYADYTIGN